MTMDLDDIKSAWQTLDARLARQDALQLELLRGQKQAQARRNLRPLLFGMALQAMLGIGLVLLGVGCWHNNLDVPGLLAAGIALHAFGILHIALAGIVSGLATTLDYALPVLAIQKRLRLLLRVQVLNSNLCGAPWWVLWVLVVIGFAGLSPERVPAPTPTWIWISLVIGTIGTLATWLWAARGTRGPRDPLARMDDGADGIRRSLRVYEDLERFERE
ncbi:hypothetical protein [Thermomonas carbonis]|uniref:Serine/threonine protein kinase n=1 Tax=Thermomonas carbonis TaxID=1463158 RepID=A0A7G9SMB9_9GAMM|nr:hypothetical protein [Thermomonas carbonis]QNN68994.1 hypothetical protein H9L16_09700 [Thermomonas carbonis]